MAFPGNTTTISDSTITVGRDNNVTNNTYNSYSTHERDPMVFLQEKVAFSALHDSAERFDSPKCHPETRTAMLNHIDQWSKDRSENAKPVLWLSGAAGAGKSAIAQTLVEKWKKEALIVLAFFFWRTGPERNHKTRLIPTFAYQLSNLLPDTKVEIQKNIDQGNIFKKNSQAQLDGLMIRPLEGLPADQQAVIIVIDGLDECCSDLPKTKDFKGQGYEAQQREILDLVASACQIVSSLRVLVVSRPEREIRECFGRAKLDGMTCRVSLNDARDADADIQLFLGYSFAELRRSHPSLPSSWPSPRQLSELVRRSSGQFIYPSTAVKYITSRRQHPVKSLENILDLQSRPQSQENPLADLDALYHLVMQSIAPESLKTVKMILLCISDDSIDNAFTGVLHPLGKTKSPLFFEKFLFLPPGEIFTHLTDLYSALRIPAPDRSDQAMSFYHATMVEYLTDKDRSGYFSVGERSVWKELAQITLKHIRALLSAARHHDNDSFMGEWLNTLKEHVVEEDMLKMSKSLVSWLQNLAHNVRSQGLHVQAKVGYEHRDCLRIENICLLNNYRLQYLATFAFCAKEIIHRLVPPDCNSFSTFQREIQRRKMTSD